MEFVEVAGVRYRVVVVGTLDGAPGTVLNGELVVQDTRDAQLNMAIARAMAASELRRDRDDTF